MAQSLLCSSDLKFPTISKESQMADNEAFVHQNMVEAGTLTLLGDAIRSAIAWPLPHRQPGRKVATVRYLCQLYRQTLERVLAIEENDAYMDIVSESHPRFEEKLEKLRREHGAYRVAWQEITPRLDRVAATKGNEFEQLCEQISALLRKVDSHLQRESDLNSEAALVDLGGEGGSSNQL
jgi:hypothetical protein